MPQVIQDWLGTRLGVLLDLSPEKFGRNTKDGTLLAKLLYNYSVIPVHVFEKIKGSKNYYECFNNLQVLKPWLNYIGVTHDDCALQKMARGEGLSAISIFYAVYLNLERKDRLHYLSAQKERRYTENSYSRRFKVDWVPETEIGCTLTTSPSKMPQQFFEKKDMIDWHREKCKEVVEIIKKTKEKFSKTFGKKKSELGPIKSRYPTSQPLNKQIREVEETKEKISAFEKKHLQEGPDLNYSELIKLKNSVQVQPCLYTPNFEEVNKIVDHIKMKKKDKVYARNFQQKMQCLVLDSEWKKILDKQNRDFENCVCENLLRQSQYEKQMISKLSLMRNQKKVLAQNRKMIENLKTDRRDKEYMDILRNNLEAEGEYWEEEEFEKERNAEVHRRIFDEKARKRKRLLKSECHNIIEALIDMAIRISEVREVTGCQIPKSLMKDLKELFIKNLPINDLLNNLEELHESVSEINISGTNESTFGEDEAFERDSDKYEVIKNQEAKRQSVLDECDFNDYMELLGSWMVELLFPDSSETEVKSVVLGYIVHKLLEHKYPTPNTPVPPALKPMKPVGIVLNLYDETGINMLTDIMEACQVLVVRVEDAINFVLATYKEELALVTDIDVTFQKVTADALRGDKSVDTKKKEIKKKKEELLKKNVENPVELEEEVGFLDKQTQTPGIIPEEDTILSPNAGLGKLAFEALGSGDPVPDHVIVLAIVAYVVSKQDDYNGWVLINYPNLYTQASHLESALTGFQILPLLGEMDTLENVERFTYREHRVNPFIRDDFLENRRSRLVPTPNKFLREEIEVPKTFFDVFIEMKKTTTAPRATSAYLPLMEKFYSEREILYDLEYQTITFQLIKNLSKIILGKVGQSTTELISKPSVEIFGNCISQIKEKWENTKKKTAKLSDKGGTKTTKADESLTAFVKRCAEVNKEQQVEEKDAKKSQDSQAAKPGDQNWEWASGPQPEVLLMALAGIWENMEAIYIEDFKNVFFCLRAHRSKVLSYCTFIRESMQTLMESPYEKQKLLSDFQQMFNDVDEDLRPDLDIKNELHVRVSELEQALMDVADERKQNSLKNRIRVTQDGWAAEEMANLVDLFLTAVQLEVDRCVDTCQVIMDYYISLQQKIPEKKPMEKITIPKLSKAEKVPSVTSNLSKQYSNAPLTPRNSEVTRSQRTILEQGSKTHVDRPTKTRSFTDKKKRTSEFSILNGAGEIINNILVNLTLPEDGMTPFHTFFIENVQLVCSEIQKVMEGCLAEARKSEKGVAKNPKKLSESKAVVGGNVNAEWLTALENELSRFFFRMKLILARGIFEMNEFLTTILNVLSSISEDITEMYLKEIQSISECCKVFRCAIEEEIPLQPQLELTQDKFTINQNVHMFEEDEKDIKLTHENEHKTFRFTVEQLSLLCQKLQRVAPNGEIIKRSLIYILEDLRVQMSEDESCRCFPEIWKLIEPNDLVTIMDKIYQDLEIVNWKDFIIYGLDLPLGTESEILLMRRTFRGFDPLRTELITRENYSSVNFWFETRLDHYTEVDRNEKAKDLLFRMYQVNEYQTNYSALLLALCKDFNPLIGFAKAITLVFGKRINFNETSGDYIWEQGEYLDEENIELSDVKSTKKPFCCPCMETPKKCIPKAKEVKCKCTYIVPNLGRADSDSIKHVEEDEGSSFDKPGEDDSLFDYDSAYPYDSRAIAIPGYILSNLLKASFPSFPQLSILLDCKQTFQETLDSVYQSCESYDGNINVHKLLQNKFFERLIRCTNKFKFIEIGEILLPLMEQKHPASKAECNPDKMNITYYLN